MVKMKPIAGMQIIGKIPTLGVTNYKDAPVEEVHFVVHGKTAHYLFTKPIHESQVSHWNEDGSLDVKLKVKINYELKRLLLSYAADITILSPQSLVEEHKESLRMALEQYK
jgi:predicted DNA-binding transcriptional regulator YafY